MKIHKLALFVCCMSSFSAVAQHAQTVSLLAQSGTDLVQPASEIAQSMTDFEWFRVFPYVDKSYTLASQGRFSEAVREIERARRIVPNNLNLLIYQAELLIAQGRLQDAMALLEPYQDAASIAQYIAANRPASVRAMSTSEFLILLAEMDHANKARFAEDYVASNGDTMTAAELTQTLQEVGKEQHTPALRSTVSEYWFRLQRPELVVHLYSDTCLQDDCEPREQQQWLQAKLLANDFSGLDSLLANLSGSDYNQALQMSADRMIGAGELDKLRMLLQQLHQDRRLDDAWGILLYQLTTDARDIGLANQLAEYYPVGCLNHAEFLLDTEQSLDARDHLAGCRPTQTEEARYLILAQRTGDARLLEDLRFSDGVSEQVRVGLLADAYRQSNDLNALIRTLEAYPGDNVVFKQLLARSYYEMGRVNDALRVSEYSWRQQGEQSAFDYYTFILMSEARYDELIEVVSHPRAARLANTQITERVLNSLERQLHAVPTSTLANIAQRWPDPVRSRVAEMLAQRGDCPAAERLKPDIAEQSKTFIDSYCAGAPQQRLAAMQRSDQEWGDDEYLRAAVLAMETRSYQLALDYTNALSPDVEVSLYRALQLSALVELGRSDEALEKWLMIESNHTADEIALGALLALEAGERAQLVEVQERLNRLGYRPLALPLKLRLAELDGDLDRQLSVLENQAEVHPNEPYYLLAQAYVQERRDRPNASARLFAQVFAEYPDTQTQLNLEQAAFVNVRANRQNTAKAYLQQSIDARIDAGVYDSEGLDRAQRQYREARSPWQATLAGWVGQSTNVSQVTGNDFQADYFLSTHVTYNLDYNRGTHTNLSLFANLLSAGDGFFFDSNSLDTGVQWQPSRRHQAYLQVANRYSFDNSDARIYLRGTADVLSGFNAPKTWLEQSRAFDHSLYVDWIFFTDEQTSGVYGRYQLTYQFGGANRSFFRFGAYPFVQHQWTNDTFNQERLTDTRAGLGITWRQPWGESHYRRWQAFTDIGFEWQHVIDSQIAGVSDNALLLRFSVQF